MIATGVTGAESSLSRILLVGCDNYDYLDQLPSVRRNLESLGELLADTELEDQRHCTWILGPDREEFAEAVNTAADQATDLLLIYYAGHGFRADHDGTLHLATKGSSPKRLWAALEIGQLRQAFLNTRAKRKVLILDCCFSGHAIGADMGAAGSQIADQAVIEGTYVLTATSPTRTALAPLDAEYTAFTGEMVAVLRDGIPDAGPDLACQRLYEETRLRCLSKAFPELQQSNKRLGGRISLARNRAHQAEAGRRLRSVALEPLDFDVKVTYYDDVPPDTGELTIMLDVDTRGPGGAAALTTPGRRALVFLVGCSANRAAARTAVAEVIEILSDGVRFAIVAGSGRAEMVYPPLAGLAVASAATRAEAVRATRDMQGGGAMIRTCGWFSAR